MPYFSTPTAPRVPLTAGPGHPGHSLFRHYRPHEAGANVFIVDGAVTTVEPDYATVTPEHIFLGSHIYEVDEDVAALLTAAGYTLLDYTPPAPSVPLPGTPDPDEYGTPTAGFGQYGGGEFGEGFYGGTPSPDPVGDPDADVGYGLQSHFDLDAIFDTARYV